MAIVEAVGVSANIGGYSVKKSRARAIEAAMSAAVIKAYAEGILDPEIIHARMQEARRAVKE